MQDFKGRTAVVTGAASGIGRALAERFGSAGMRVVLADVEEAPLREAEESLLERGVETIAVRTDVRKLESIEELHARAIEAFGKVHVLCNNAGVGSGGLTWQTANTDWEWVLGVNLWGVINGVRSFLPGMLEHGEEGHIVNTASMAGMVAGPFMGPYNVSKFGVVAFSETLFHELKLTGAKIGVSVLCPGWVNTRIGDSSRNRPEELPAAPLVPSEGGPQMQDVMRNLLASGMPPAELAEIVLRSVEERRFYILTHPDMKDAIRARFDAILEERDPGSTGFM
ncbi:MAG: SDR family NAD(P)-dependent oxidoreductase [Chloroflexi bacterium]|nr:SDR family NAD(P)-dependent oxidoreductase [Chloroflexota bacterium]